MLLLKLVVLVTVGCLVLHQRYKRRVENYLSLTKELSTESVDTKDTVINDAERNTFIRTESDDQETMRNRLRQTVQSQDTCTSTSSAPDIEDLCKPMNGDKTFRSNEMCSSSFACSGQSRQQCQTLVNEYNERQQLEFMEFYNSIQSLRHTVLLILLLCSMFVVCISRIDSQWIAFVSIFVLNRNLCILFFFVVHIKNSRSHYPCGH